MNLAGYLQTSYGRCVLGNCACMVSRPMQPNPDCPNWRPVEAVNWNELVEWQDKTFKRQA